MRNREKKLIVMIPCYNEEKALPLVVKSIPRKIPGIKKVEILVIDDGSTDKTSEVAKKLKVDYLIRHRLNKGLARTFATGIETALQKGADIIINTDGDNQYPQQDIPRLIEPILNNKAQVVIGNRQTSTIGHFSPTKKLLQWLGSKVVSWTAGVSIPDAPSGFRAFSKNAAMQMNIVTDFSHVAETLIQAGKKKIPITSIPIKINHQTRKSRLFKTNWGYLKKQGGTIIRVFAMYEPLKIFSYIGGAFFITGLILGGRFMYFYLFNSRAAGHVQSLILASVFLTIGFQIFLIGLVADLIASNRKLIENGFYRLKKNGLKKKR